MANMEHCMFYNTYNDLEQCAEVLSQGKKLSEEEEKYKNKLLNLAKELVRDFTNIEEEILSDNDFEDVHPADETDIY